jgi:protein-histidine pros-kinase
VLLIDDEEQLLRAYGRFMQRGGFEVELAGSAEAALRALQRGSFDLIMSDIGMPNMTGIQLVEHLRASGNDTPVVLMTGTPHIDTAMVAVAHGVSRYLPKPVDRLTLLEAANAAVSLHGLARARRLARDNACLREVIDDLVRARAAAQAASEARQRFLSQMSHELKTPMTHIMGFTDLALDTDLSGEQRGYLETSQAAAHGLLKLIDNILHVSALGSGEQPLEPETAQTRPKLESMLRPLLDLGRAKGLSMTLVVAAAVPDVLTGDFQRLEQVIGHVVDNAIKFTKQGGTVTVRVTAELDDDAAVLRVSVTDSGVGIPESARERIFEPFAQADNSSTRGYGGAGLGLTISAMLVERMRGTIHVDSSEGVGTMVTFTGRFAMPPRSVTGS